MRNSQAMIEGMVLQSNVLALGAAVEGVKWS
jgi:hypothetical protein